jgi:hypothetical protein
MLTYAAVLAPYVGRNLPTLSDFAYFSPVVIFMAFVRETRLFGNFAQHPATHVNMFMI